MTQTTKGGHRLVQLQNTNGGWDSPLDDGDPGIGSDSESFAAVAMGLCHAYRRSSKADDPNMLAALEQVKVFLLSKSDDFSVLDGALAFELDSVLGGTMCVDHVKTNFYDALASGNYLLFDTAGYIQALRLKYGGNVSNLAAWELGAGLYSAYIVGADTTEWLAGLKAEIDELDSEELYDVLGLAGAVLGLAASGEDYDPQAGAHAAASNLGDLAVTLAGYQISTGGFTWHGAYMGEGVDETVRETVYGCIALSEFDRHTYSSQIASAGTYLQSVQLATDGWENYGASGEDNEVTGEAIWAIVTSTSVLGDFDRNGFVNFDDFATFALAWSTERGASGWNPYCEISIPSDSRIDTKDLASFVDNWLEDFE
jgi:hypothetical protein